MDTKLSVGNHAAFSFPKSGNALYPARYAALEGGVPVEVPASFVEMQCGSAITAVNAAACRIIAQEARKEGISMPITEQVYEVLFNQKKPSEALKDLMNRDLKPEIHN